MESVHINASEIEVMRTALSTAMKALEAGRVRANPDREVSVIGNPFPEFKWMAYHPYIQLGGAIGATKEKMVLTNEGALVWLNAVKGGPGASWHPVVESAEEVIAPLE